MQHAGHQLTTASARAMAQVDHALSARTIFAEVCHAAVPLWPLWTIMAAVLVLGLLAQVPGRRLPG